MGGKLFVIDGVDGSGKATQTNLLYERLLNDGYMVKKVEFPNYDSPSSGLIKMYLGGEFGVSVDDVSPYVASTFYAVDRFASFRKDWQSFYEQGGIILADRYTTSNMIHQASKIDSKEEREKYLQWLVDFEYNLFKLPEPNMVLFLDMLPQYSKELREKRNTLKSDLKMDIHEEDLSYLFDAYKTAMSVALEQKWNIVSCVNGGTIRKVDDIHEEVFDKIKQKLV